MIMIAAAAAVHKLTAQSGASYRLKVDKIYFWSANHRDWWAMGWFLQESTNNWDVPRQLHTRLIATSAAVEALKLLKSRAIDVTK